METRAYRLRLHAPLHVGDMGIGSEVTHAYVPSDTLFSALVVTWRNLPGITPNLLAAVEAGEAPLLLSSAFPYAGDTLLLPKPALPLQPAPPPGESGKRFRRVRWVSQSIFSQLLAAPGQAQLDVLWQAGATVQEGAAWVSAGEAADLSQPDGDPTNELRLWRTTIVPRVVVDRVHGAGQIHHTGRVSFAPGCGLWFLAQGEARWLDALEQVLRVLGDQGLGGKRSVGNGQFTHEPMPAPPLPAGRTGYVVLLSRTAPRLEEMPLLRRPQAAYDLVLVGGFTGTPGDGPVVRRQVRMLTEGSVVGAPAEGAGLGHLVDVTPEATPWLGHYVLRSGLGFAVPIQLLAADAEKETFR